MDAHRRRPRRAIAIVGTALVLLTLLQCRTAPYVASAGFWFDRVTFELSRPDETRLGGPILDNERQVIEAMAWRELRAAYAGLRISFSTDHYAFYRVQVVQSLPGSSAAGASHVLPPLGGQGAVSFQTLASLAIAHAPPGAERVTILEGIGRGIGRAAVHEFAHQIVPTVPIDSSDDPQSYEYHSADRATQYYGPMRWSLAWPALERKLGG